MRIRSIKPEFWRSDDIVSLDWATRLLFIGLWSYVDDNGVGRDEEKLIVADLFPLEEDTRETLATVSRGLRELSRKGLIHRYEVDGRAYLDITNWKKHQRLDHPNKPRFPQYDADRESLATPSLLSRESLATGTREQGNKGTEELGNNGTGERPLSDAYASDQGTLLPDSWTPTQKHVDLAASLHLSLDQALSTFRRNATENHRRQKNWNAAFTNWLRKGAEFAQKRSGVQQPQQLSKAAKNALEYQRIYGGGNGGVGSVQAAHLGISA